MCLYGELKVQANIRFFDKQAAQLESIAKDDKKAVKEGNVFKSLSNFCRGKRLTASICKCIYPCDQIWLLRYVTTQLSKSTVKVQDQII